MPSVSYWPRLLLASAAGLGLAVILAVHAFSVTAVRNSPQVAASLFPVNGLALEQSAFAMFIADQSGDASALEVSLEVNETALTSVSKEALTPKSHTLLAISADDSNTRATILAAAEKLNRRDASLQGMLLQEYLDKEDDPATIATLDRLLRVNPERSREFFPVLAAALANEETLPVFGELLDNASPWHQDFLEFASRQRDSLQGLAAIRSELVIESDTFDRRLITGLIAQGDEATASRIYRQVTGKEIAIFSGGTMDWQSEYPPFDWRLIDEPGFRAQPSRDGAGLEITIRPGKGGIIAARLIDAPSGPFKVSVDLQMSQSQQLRDVRVQLLCPNSTTPFFDERLSRQGDGFEVPAVPEDCDYQILAINARAWSGRSALSGTIRSIEIS